MSKEINYKEASERMAAYITTLDIDEDVCKKVDCCMKEHDEDIYTCVDCIISFFNKKCIFELSEVCVNDKSEHCADFVSTVECGRCKFRSEVD